MLDTERAYFDSHLDDLRREYRGKFVIIKGEEATGGFDTIAEALAEGARKYGLQSFLARRIDDIRREVSVPALTLGLLSANPPRTVCR